MRWFHICLGVFLGIIFMVSCSLQQDGEGLVFDAMGNVIAAIALLAEEVGFNNINTKLSADNVQAAIEEGDAKSEGLQDQLDDALEEIATLKDKANNPSIYSLQCSSDMQQLGDRCVETTRRQATIFSDAVKTCASAGRRLCNAEEIIGFCHQNQGGNSDLVAYEWTSTLTRNTSTSPYKIFAIGLNILSNCSIAQNGVSDINSSFPRDFRCCSDLQLFVQ